MVPLLLLQQLAVGILCGLLLGKLAILGPQRGGLPIGTEPDHLHLFCGHPVPCPRPPPWAETGISAPTSAASGWAIPSCPRSAIWSTFDVVTDVAQVLIFFLLACW